MVTTRVAALANLAAGNASNRDAIWEAGAVGPLVSLLQGGAASEADPRALPSIVAMLTAATTEEDATSTPVALLSSVS